MIVGNCMKRQVVSIQHTATIGEAADFFISHHIGMLPVIDDTRRLVGILLLRDLLELVMPAFIHLLKDFDFVSDFGFMENQHPSQDVMNHPVTTIMEPPTSVQSSSGLLRAFAMINSHDLVDLPVVDDQGHLVGLASHVDIGRALLSNWHQTAANMEVK